MLKDILQRYPIIKWFLIFDVVVIVIFIVILIINSFKTVTIAVNVAPADAVVKIGGGTYQNGAYKIFPSSGEVEVSCDGFQTKSFTVDLTSNDYIKIETYLLPDDGDLNYYIETGNDADLQILREVNADVADEVVTEFLEEYDKKSAIINELPMLEQTYLATNEDGVFFTIKNNNGENCKYMNLCLLVSPMVNVTKDDIEEYLINKGYDPSDYQIEYEEDVEL